MFWPNKVLLVRALVNSDSSHRITHVNFKTTLSNLIFSIFQSSSASFESALLGEAHGLITDMLADTTLPSHVVGRLRTISNLLKPPENHSSFHKPRVSPLVSLTESAHYGSDTEESPYTGERPSTLPKVCIKKSQYGSTTEYPYTGHWRETQAL